ncbi:MAG: ComEC/Rec2 family competence protein [Porcipelethomonas sp.]
MAKRKNAKSKKGWLLAAAACIIAAGAYAADHFRLYEADTWKGFFSSENTAAEGELSVHFLDVGQGDCSLIVSGDRAILIDTGEKENGEMICEYLEEHNIPDIDCLLLTHPHSDHMGAASYVIDNMDVGQIIIPKVDDDLTPTTKFYENFLESVEEKNLKITAAKPGLTVDAGDGELEIISPVKDYSDLNNYSAAAILTHGNDSFLFTGDIEKKAEKDILEEGYLKDIDVLKVPHHGSSTSSHRDFLDTVLPDYAVIMCDGKSYNHPHEETIERIFEYTDKVYRTDLDGTIVFESSGDGLSVTTEK